MAGYGWGQLISALLSLVGGASGMASGVGGTVGDVAGAVSQYAKPAAEMASAGGQFAGAIGSRPTTIGGTSGSPQIGGGAQTPGITADQLRTGLASTRAQSQAAGVYGNQDYELENMAKTLGIDVAQLKQMMSTMGVA